MPETQSGVVSLDVMYHTAVTVTATGLVPLLEGNMNRVYALFINDSENVVYLNKRGEPAAANTGIRLNANGGAYEMAEIFDNLWTGRVTGYAAANSVVLVTEGEI